MSASRSASFSCQVIDASLIPVEHARVTVSEETLSLAIAGASTLRSVVIDNIESLIQWDVIQRESSDRRHCLIHVHHDADVVLLMETPEEVAQLCDALWRVHLVRCEMSGRNLKLVRYKLDEPVSVALSSHVRWNSGDKRGTIPYPHSRLDFLRLHGNRSVMFKLSSNEEYRIELSCDGVTAWSSAFEHSGSPQAERLPDSMQSDFGLASQWIQQHSSASLVAIVTESALTLTEPTGFVLVRVPFVDVATMHCLHDRSAPGARDTPVVVVVWNAGGAEQQLMLASRYALDIVNRVKASSDFLRSVAAAATPPLLAGPSETTRTAPATQPPRVATMACAWTQTDTSGAVKNDVEMFPDAPDGDAVAAMLRHRNKELSETVAHREVTIKILQQRCEQLALSEQPRGSASASTPRSAQSGTPRRSVTPRGAMQRASHPQQQQQQGTCESASSRQLDVLRHYAAMLEVALRAEREKNLEERVIDLEGQLLEQADSREVELLKYALKEGQREIRLLERKVKSLQGEMRQLTAAQNRALGEIAVKANTQIQEFILAYKASERALAPRDCMRIVDDFDARLQQEVTIRTRDLVAANAALIEELRDREKAVDEIGREVMASVGVGDSVQWHMAALLQKKQALEGAVSTLSRQADDLKQVRNKLQEEVRRVFGQLDGDDRTRMDTLQAQVAVLEKLSNVPLATSRLASLEVLAAEHETKLAALMEEAAKAAESQQQCASLRKASEHASLELRKCKARIHQLEQQNAQLTADKAELQAQLDKTVDTMKAEAREHRKQERYQRERVQELLRAAKQNNAPLTSDPPASSGTPARSAASGPITPRPATSGAPHRAAALQPSESPQPRVQHKEHAARSPSSQSHDEPEREDPRIESLAAAIEIIQAHNPAWTAPPDVAAQVSQSRSRSRGGSRSCSYERSQQQQQQQHQYPSIDAAAMGVVEADSRAFPSAVDKDLELLRERARSLQLERERAEAEDHVARLQAELVLSKHGSAHGAPRPRSVAHQTRAPAKRPTSPAASSSAPRKGPGADPRDPEVMVALARERFAKMKQRLTANF